LWAGVGGGGRKKWHSIATTSRPPTPALPHKGEGEGAAPPPQKLTPPRRRAEGGASGVPNLIALSLRRWLVLIGTSQGRKTRAKCRCSCRRFFIGV
jgi:hypothetical protein